MKIDFLNKTDLSLEDMVLLESESSDYLNDRLLEAQREGQMPDQQLLKTGVSFADTTSKKVGNSSWITSVSTMVSLIYESNQTTSILSEKLFDLAISGQILLDFSFTNDYHTIYFEPMENDTSVLYSLDTSSDTDEESSSDSSSDTALVLAISILSIMLVLVSGVLLYISGCLETCRGKCINCLFEEVVDEEFVLAHNSSFKTKTHPTYDDDEEEAEVKSVAASPAPTNASGVLGAQYQVSPMLAGLGIKTPSKLDSGSMMTYDDDDVAATPMSAATNHLPLGITSMRKMPQPESPDVQRGMTGMIMGRFASNTGKKLKL